MIVELLTTGAIISICAAVTWFAKTKFQPKIEESMARVEEQEATLRKP